MDDRGLYAPGQLWLTPKDVVGRAKGFLPYVGMVTIMMNEYPKLKVNYFYLTQLFQFFIKQILFYTVCCACLPRPVCSDSQRVNAVSRYFVELCKIRKKRIHAILIGLDTKYLRNFSQSNRRFKPKNNTMLSLLLLPLQMKD